MTEFKEFFAKKIIFVCLLIIFLIGSSFFYQLRPVSSSAHAKIFEVSQGQRFWEIVGRLESEKLIRSSIAFGIYAAISGSARKIKPGIYRFSGAMSSEEIMRTLSVPGNETEITIIDGASVYDVDVLLSKKNILPEGFLVSFSGKNDIEGKLYPDTYKFFEHSTVEQVVNKFLENFQTKAEPLLDKDPIHYKSNLILASLVQKEVSEEKDSKIVAGILKKRLSFGMALNVDATICYLKKALMVQLHSPREGQFSCYPLTPEDFKINSPYNTYLHAGLPPGPIGSPNEAAIKAVLSPLNSPYWFYLSDPKTGKTIFSKTLEEQNANRRIYLK